MGLCVCVCLFDYLVVCMFDCLCLFMCMYMQVYVILYLCHLIFIKKFIHCHYLLCLSLETRIFCILSHIQDNSRNVQTETEYFASALTFFCKAKAVRECESKLRGHCMSIIATNWATVTSKTEILCRSTEIGR